MWFGGPGASGFFGGYGYNGAPGQSEVIPMHDGILVGKGEAPQHLLFAMANRHGLIVGATGTGKTVSGPGPSRGPRAGRRVGVLGGCEGRSLRDRPARGQ
jgi:hypothetical protein